MSNELSTTEDDLFRRVAEIIESARTQVARTVNTAMVHAYWLIGREIVEVEQEGKVRAEYGEELVESLAERLMKQFGKGFNISGLKRMRQFYRAFPGGSMLPPELGGPGISAAARHHFALDGEIGSAPRHLSVVATEQLFPPHLSWTHYRILLTVTNPTARAFYEIEAVREAWSTRELERQVGSLLFERLAKSRDKEQVQALAREGHEVTVPIDVIKDPFVLEFLNLPERP